MRLFVAAVLVVETVFAVQGPPTPEELALEQKLWLDEYPDQTWKVVGQYPTAPGTVHTTVFSADEARGLYNHSAHIAWQDGLFHATWSNQRYDEDAAGERVLYASSPDGLKWSAPRELVPSLSPETPWGYAGVYSASLDFVSYDGRLFGSGFTSEILAWESMDREKRSRVRTDECVFPVYGGRIRVYREIKSDGSFGRLFSPEREKLPKELLCPVFSQAAVEPGFTLPPPAWGTGDVLTKYPKRRLNEPTAWKRADGTFVMLLRDDSNSFRKWLSLSADGWKWSCPCVTDIYDARSASCAATLDDGTVLLITNPRGKGINDPVLGWRDRDPLTISISRDGLHFGSTHTVKEGYHRFKVDLKTGPRGRGGSAAYPSVLVKNGYCYVIYSLGKEDIGLTRIPLAALLKKSEKASYEE